MFRNINNFLIDEKTILEVTREFLGPKCPYSSTEDISSELKELLFSKNHLNPYIKALLSNQIIKIARNIYNTVLMEKSVPDISEFPKFQDTKAIAEQNLNDNVSKNTGKEICKGRNLIKAYCVKNKIRYENFRNALIYKMEKPPEGLKKIMDQIL